MLLRKPAFSPGAHSQLIRAVIERLGGWIAPAGHLLYAGDTGAHHAFAETGALAGLGLALDPHGKWPDVVLHDTRRDWLVLIEAVTSHGPIDARRHAELAALFGPCGRGLVYVSAFPDRATFRRHAADIAWETEAWLATDPDHLIHFNGDRYWGPHASSPAAGS